MNQARAAGLKRLPGTILPKGGAFRQGHTALILLLPSLVVVFGIVIYPLIRTFYTSLFDVTSAFPGNYPFVGLGNYLEALGRTEFWAAILRTAYFTLSTTPWDFRALAASTTPSQVSGGELTPASPSISLL